MALLLDSWLMELLTVVVTLISGLYFFFVYQFSYWKKKGVPYPPPSIPFGNIGDMAMVKATAGDVIESIYKQMDGHKFAGYYQLSIPAFLIRDPEMIKNVFVKDFAHFQDRGIYSDEKNDPLSAHLLTMTGMKWKHMRYKLTPTFTSGKMKMMFPTVVECGLELQKHLQETADRNETLEVKDVLAKYSTDVIATCAFGIQSNSLKNPDSEFRRMGKKALEPSLTNTIRDTISFLAPKLFSFLRLHSIPTDVSDFFRGVVKETVHFRETNNISRNDFMQLLIRIKNKKSVVDQNETQEDDMKNVEKEENYYDVHGMTDDEVAAQAFVFFIAGFESSSTTMSFALYELAFNQHVQDQLRDEIDSVLIDHEGKFTYEALTEMKYLDNIIAETLRKYAPIPAIVRKCTKDYKVPDTDIFIEEGTTVMIPVQALHYDPQYYPDPQKFDPERFTEDVTSNRHHFVYLPFGEGPRSCIGSRFGLMQTKVGLASLIVKHQFHVCKSTPVPLVFDPKSFMPSIIGGINLQITDRK